MFGILTLILKVLGIILCGFIRLNSLLSKIKIIKCRFKLIKKIVTLLLFLVGC